MFWVAQSLIAYPHIQPQALSSPQPGIVVSVYPCTQPILGIIFDVAGYSAIKPCEQKFNYMLKPAWQILLQCLQISLPGGPQWNPCSHILIIHCAAMSYCEMFYSGNW